MSAAHRSDWLTSPITGMILMIAMLFAIGLVATLQEARHAPAEVALPEPQDLATTSEYPQPGIKVVTYYTGDGDKCRLWLQDGELKLAQCAWRDELERAALAAWRLKGLE